MKITVVTGNPEVKLGGQLAKYAEPLAKAENFQLRQIAEKCHQNLGEGWDGLSRQDTRRLQLWCEQEVVRRELKEFRG